MASPRTPRKSAHDPIREQLTSRRALERKAMEFDITIHEVSFNYSGRYFLKLSVNSSFTSDLSSLRVRTGQPIDGPTRGFRFGAEARTEVTDQLQQDEIFNMNAALFSFYMPVGFNKNDKDHDVFLLIEAFDISEETAQFQRIGEARTPIYPRTDVEMNFDLEIGDPIYRFTSKLPILRTNAQDSLHMHCGSVHFTCQLIEAWPIEEDVDRLEPLPRPARKKQPEPQPRPKPKKEPPVRMTPRGERQKPQQMAEDPEASHKAADPLAGDCRLVAPATKEEVTVILHGANDIKSQARNRLPRSYVTVQSKFDEDVGSGAQGVTHATVKATNSPSWEEMVNVTMDANRAPDEVVVVKVGDKDTREMIHEFRIPVGCLQPFHNYHLDMHRFNGEEGRLFASVVRKQDHLPEAGSGLSFRAVEACLVGMRHSLRNPAGALICVAKVVSDYYNFVNELLAFRNSGLELAPAQFPNPHPTTFFVSDRWTGQGQAQVTLPGRPVTRPQWHHPFLFCDQRELATLFTVGAALVLEFYDFNNASVNEAEWRTSRPVGYSVLPLDSAAYRQLSAPGADKGVVVELPVQSRQLRTNADKLASVLLLLRLHSDPQPPSFSPETLGSDLRHLVRLDPTHLEVPPEDFLDQEGDGPYEPGAEDPNPRLGLDWEWDPYRDLAVAAKARQRQRQPLPITDGELPSDTAVESVLPDLNYIFPAPRTHRPAPRPQQQQQQQQQQQLQLLPSQQADQPQRYKEAMRHMGQDILSLRDRIRELEAERSALQRDLTQHTDTGFLLRDFGSLETVSKSELISRYASLKNSLVSASSELSEQKEKLRRLQQRAGQQQQQRSGLLQLTDAHAAKQPLVQRLQAKAAKVKKLEAACAKQQQVMDRMQRLLAASRPQEAVAGETLARALTEENRRLREEISQLRDGQQLQQQLERRRLGVGDMDEGERTELYGLLDRAEAKIVALERQVEEKAAKWTAERGRLEDRLRNAKAQKANK